MTNSQVRQKATQLDGQPEITFQVTRLAKRLTVIEVKARAARTDRLGPSLPTQQVSLKATSRRPDILLLLGVRMELQSIATPATPSAAYLQEITCVKADAEN